MALHDPRQRILESNQWIYRHTEVLGIVAVWMYQFSNKGKLLRVIR